MLRPCFIKDGPDRTGVSVCLPPITTRGLSHLSINLIIPITPWLIILTGDGYWIWSLPHLRAKSCSAQLTFPSVHLFDYLLPTGSVYPPWLSAACPWPSLPCVYSITCLPPASTLCLLSVYDSVYLRYPWRCSLNRACPTCCTSNKAAHGSQHHWLCVTRGYRTPLNFAHKPLSTV